MFSITKRDPSFIGRWWWSLDRWIVIATLLLLGIGVILIMAGSPAVADRLKLNSFYFARRHVLMIIPTVFLMLGVSFLSLKQIRLLAFLGFGLAVFFLILTPFVGVEIKGARRWINIFGFSLQASEFLKPTFAVVTAWFLYLYKKEPGYPWIWISLGSLGGLIFLLLLQPDLGMVVMISGVWCAQFFLSGIPLWIVGIFAGVSVSGLLGAYFLFPHVSSRIDRFLATSGDKYSDFYQINQSLDAFANGGFLGQGPGEGVVKKYLPDAHADFIFAVAGEEFGFLLCAFIAVLFVFIIIRSFMRVIAGENLYLILSVGGLATGFGLQALINMSSSLKLIPTKGMTLPFMSYGGSSLLALGFMMGMILGFTKKRFEIKQEL
jgi:cell division protein FtsW